MNFRSHTPYDRRYQIMEAEYESILPGQTVAVKYVPVLPRLGSIALLPERSPWMDYLFLLGFALFC